MEALSTFPSPTSCLRAPQGRTLQWNTKMAILLSYPLHEKIFSKSKVWDRFSFCFGAYEFKALQGVFDPLAQVFFILGMGVWTFASSTCLRVLKYYHNHFQATQIPSDLKLGVKALEYLNNWNSNKHVQLAQVPTPCLKWKNLMLKHQKL